METYATWARLSELQRYYSWIVDRFQVSTIVDQRRAHGREFDFGWLEAPGRLTLAEARTSRMPPRTIESAPQRVERHR